MVFDSIAVNGRDVSKQGLFDRLTAVGQHVLAPLKAQQCDCPVSPPACHFTRASCRGAPDTVVLAGCADAACGQGVLPRHQASQGVRPHHNDDARWTPGVSCSRCSGGVGDESNRSWLHGGTRYLYRGAHGTNLNDGVVFTPGDQGYWQAKGTLLKWKWFEDNTVDFFVDGNAIWDALAQPGKPCALGLRSCDGLSSS